MAFHKSLLKLPSLEGISNTMRRREDIDDRYKIRLQTPLTNWQVLEYQIRNRSLQRALDKPHSPQKKAILQIAAIQISGYEGNYSTRRLPPFCVHFNWNGPKISKARIGTHQSTRWFIASCVVFSWQISENALLPSFACYLYDLLSNCPQSNPLGMANHSIF